jgi:hypothetical protein
MIKVKSQAELSETHVHCAEQIECTPLIVIPLGIASLMNNAIFLCIAKIILEKGGCGKKVNSKIKQYKTHKLNCLVFIREIHKMKRRFWKSYTPLKQIRKENIKIIN